MQRTKDIMGSQTMILRFFSLEVERPGIFMSFSTDIKVMFSVEYIFFSTEVSSDYSEASTIEHSYLLVARAWWQILDESRIESIPMLSKSIE